MSGSRPDSIPCRSEHGASGVQGREGREGREAALTFISASTGGKRPQTMSEHMLMLGVINPHHSGSGNRAQGGSAVANRMYL